MRCRLALMSSGSGTPLRAAVSKLSGIRLAGEAVREIRCYLTGPQAGDGTYGISRYRVADKHGIRHALYNAKINIHREAGDSIFLGVRNQAFAVREALSAARPTLISSAVM